MTPAAAGLLTSSLVVMTLGGIFSPFLKPESREGERGLAEYRKGEWVESVERFRRALAERPDPVLQYNLGAAAYQGQNYPEAVQAFGAASPSEKVPAGRLLYDLGNALYRSGNLPEALGAYREALRENPDDEDARFNYELTLRQLAADEKGQSEEQRPEDRRQGQESEGDRDPSAPDSSAQSPPRDEDAGQEGGERGPSPTEQPHPESGPEGEQSSPPPPGGEESAERLLSPREAQQLLNAVTPEERELIQARLQSGRRRKVEKDW
jgi:Ca-activated chloride channel family protein